MDKTPRMTLNRAGMCLHAGQLVSRPSKIFQARPSLSAPAPGGSRTTTAWPFRYSAGVYVDADGGGMPPHREARKGIWLWRRGGLRIILETQPAVRTIRTRLNSRIDDRRIQRLPVGT
jgi:hypothetical protein